MRTMRTTLLPEGLILSQILSMNPFQILPARVFLL